MSKETYINIFNHVKAEIIGGSVPIIIDPEFSPKDLEKIQFIKIETFCQKKLIHLTGVNVLFYIVSIYLQYELQIRPEEASKDTKVLIMKQKNFIIKENEEKIFFFSLKILESFPELFKFDLKKETST